MSDAFAIRPATPEDDLAMATLEQASGVHHHSVAPDRWRVLPVEAVAESRRLWAASDPRTEALLAVADGRVLGMIELWLRRPKDRNNARPPHVEVQFGIAVAPEARGLGVGTALLRAAEDWARAHGAERMHLGVDAANSRAIALYERLGYAITGHVMEMEIEPEPGAVDPPERIRNADGEVVPTLHGERVSLRPIRPSDRESLLEVLRDPSVVAIWDTRGAEVSVEEILAGDAGWTPWAIEVDGELAGSIQAAEEQDGDYRHAGIDIFLHSRFQGRGLGTDAVRTLARYLLEVRGHHRLTIDPAADNARAIRTYEKVGFKPVGVMRRYERGRDGTFHDGLLMDLLAGELR
jgi:aminoglycoside 6'-N-acetyltransferase